MGEKTLDYLTGTKGMYLEHTVVEMRIARFPLKKFEPANLPGDRSAQMKAVIQRIASRASVTGFIHPIRL